MRTKLGKLFENKKYNKLRKEILRTGIHSELYIARPDGKDRCDLILRSNDTDQLIELEKMLKDRGIKSELFKEFNGGKYKFKFNLIPSKKGKVIDIEKDFADLMKYLDREFMYGKPVESIEFFTEEEIKLLKKWYR